MISSMRIFDKTPPAEIYRKAYYLYQVRILTILILIPLYALTCRWGNFQVNIWPLALVVFVEVFINRPYFFLYKDSTTSYHALVASVIIDFMAETTTLHLLGNVDLFIYCACYFVSIVYCALNFPTVLTLWFATFASSLYAGLILCGHLGIIPKTVSFGPNLSLMQETAVVVRHIAFFYLIAIFIRSFAALLIKKDTQLENLIWELKATNEKVKYAYHLQTDYFARMSHEIRAPLNSILGFSQLMLESTAEPLTVKQKDFLARIEKSGKHLRDLINDVLDLSKIEAKKTQLDPQPVDLVRVVKTVFDVFYEEATQKKILLGLTERPPSPVVISCDELKIRQVLYNLLSNAMKFTPAGGFINITLEAETAGARIVIEDSGPGIAPEHREAIFQPYEQAGRVSSKAVKGTGLGLAISKQFVEMHGGKIRVESKPGEGSRFFVELPLKPPAREPEDLKPAPPAVV